MGPNCGQDGDRNRMMVPRINRKHYYQRDRRSRKERKTEERNGDRRNPEGKKKKASIRSMIKRGHQIRNL